MAFTYALSRFVCEVAAFAYPAYLAYKAIKNKSGRDITLWLVFYIVLSLFHLAEIIGDIFVFWFPFYYEMKMVFVLWLILPQTQGHLYVYQRFVMPTLNRYEPEIDFAVEKFANDAQGVLKEMWTRLQIFVHGFISEAAQRSAAAGGNQRLEGAKIEEIHENGAHRPRTEAAPAPPDALQLTTSLAASLLSSLAAAASSIASSPSGSSRATPASSKPRDTRSVPFPTTPLSSDAFFPSSSTYANASASSMANVGYPGSAPRPSTFSHSAASSALSTPVWPSSTSSSPLRENESVFQPSVADADYSIQAPAKLNQSYFSPQLQMEPRYRGNSDVRYPNVPRSYSVSTEESPLPHQVPQRRRKTSFGATGASAVSGSAPSPGFMDAIPSSDFGASSRAGSRATYYDAPGSDRPDSVRDSSSAAKGNGSDRATNAPSFLDDEIRFEEDAFRVEKDFFNSPQASNEVNELSRNPWRWGW